MTQKLKAMMMETLGSSNAESVEDGISMIGKITSGAADVINIAEKMLKSVVKPRPSIYRKFKKKASDYAENKLNEAVDSSMESTQIKLANEHAHKVAQVIIGLIFTAKIKAVTVQEKADLVIEIVGEKFVSNIENKESTNGLNEGQKDGYFPLLEGVDFKHVDIDLAGESLVDGIAI